MKNIGINSLFSSSNFTLNILKISIVGLCSFYLLGNFSPFFEGQDAYLYGIESVFLSNGIYEIPNPLLKETGQFEFTGGNWNPTIHGTLVPIAGIGTPLLGTLAYIIGGYYGLFYLGPILGITLLILYERITTKLFGKYIGLLSLLFLATCHIFFRSAILLNTDAILTLLFVLGIFFLIQFIRNGNPNYVLVTSIFFCFCSLVKIPALVFFPLEIITILSFFLIRKTHNQISFFKNNLDKRFLYQINKKKLFKISIFVLIPWVLFIGFWFSYNDFYYGSPTSTYISVISGGEHSTSSRISNILTLEQRDFDQAKDYGKYLLPYQIPAIYNKVSDNLDDTFGKHWPGLLIIPLISFSLYLSFKQKLYRLELSIFTLFIFGIVGFYAGQTPEWRAEYGLPARYMLPAISLSLIIWSFLIVRTLIIIEKNQTIKNLKFVLVILLGLFFAFAFIFSPQIQFIISDDNFKNPVDVVSKYSIEREILPEKSVILAKNTDPVIEYGITPFRLGTIESWNTEKIILLNEVLEKGYSIYTFKQSTSLDEKNVLTHIVENHDFTLLEVSEIFCKLSVDNDLTTDKICVTDSERPDD